MKNKNGLLFPEETLRIVIAIMVIFLLITLSVKIYTGIQQKNHLTQARDHLEIIERTVEGIAEGTQEQYLITSPKGWFLQYVPKNLIVFTGQNNCIGKNCLCFCPKMGWKLEDGFISDTRKSDSSDCSKINVCVPVEEGLISPIGNNELRRSGIQIKPTVIYISKNNDEILISSNQKDYDQSGEWFDEILNSNGESGLKFNDLLVLYINNREKSVKKEMNKILEDYFEMNDLDGYLSVKDVESGKPADVYRFATNLARGDYSNAPSHYLDITGSDGKLYRVIFHARKNEK